MTSMSRAVATGILACAALFSLLAGCGGSGSDTDPSIATQPQGVTVTVGAMATFNVTASGTAPFSYQWRRNGTNLTGATASSYTTPATVLGDSGAVFSVVVTNAVGSVTSSNAVLTVNAGSSNNTPLDDVTRISVGQYHTLALRADGTVLAWGTNVLYGQLGIGSLLPAFSSRPVVVPGLSGVTDIAACPYHSLALLTDGSVRTWGSDQYGALGNGPGGNVMELSPVPVTGLTNVQAVACGMHHSMVLKQDGTVWMWGRNTAGVLGNGTLDDSDAPVQVPGLDHVVAIATGHFTHAFALRDDGKVWAWGNKVQTGQATLDPPDGSYRKLPVEVQGLSSITRIAAGYAHGVAVDAGGNAWGWGVNTYGELANGDIIQMLPVQLSGIATAVSVMSGPMAFTTAVVLADGSIRTFGYNLDGQLGHGTIVSTATPASFGATGPFTAMSFGSDSAVALRSNGTVVAVGNNDLGQLGDGSQTPSLTPVAVLAP